MENKQAHDNICNYLQNLQSRLKETLQQHSQIILNSISLIKELGEVGKMLSLSQSPSDMQATRIKRLILEFENFYAGETSPRITNSDVGQLRELIADYRRLDESHLLQDSLMSFKHAKDTLDKVESLLNQLNTKGWVLAPSSSDSATRLGATQSDHRSLREKIRAFNKAAEQGKNTIQNFALCFHNNSSATLTALPAMATGSLTNSGYEGDMDSEGDQLTKE